MERPKTLLDDPELATADERAAIRRGTTNKPGKREADYLAAHRLRPPRPAGADAARPGERVEREVPGSATPYQYAHREERRYVVS